jgi:hypothetical protein
MRNLILFLAIALPSLIFGQETDYDYEINYCFDNRNYESVQLSKLTKNDPFPNWNFTDTFKYNTKMDGNKQYSVEKGVINYFNAEKLLVIGSDNSLINKYIFLKFENEYIVDNGAFLTIEKHFNGVNGEKVIFLYYKSETMNDFAWISIKENDKEMSYFNCGVKLQNALIKRFNK